MLMLMHFVLFVVTFTIHGYVQELCGDVSSPTYELRQWRETRG